MMWNDFFSLDLDEIKNKLQEDYHLTKEEINSIIEIKKENRRDENLSKVEKILKEEWNIENEVIPSYLMVYDLNTKLEAKESKTIIKNLKILSPLALIQLVSQKLIKDDRILFISSSIVFIGAGVLAKKIMKKETIKEDLVLQKVKKKVK